MLPRQSPTPSSRWVSRLPFFARRALHVDQMEFDSALSQMYSLLVKPSLVSKMSKARSMTKNHYYRDDPAFVLVQLFFFVVVNLAWGFSSNVTTVTFLGNLAYDILVNYALASLVFATTSWAVVSHYLMGRDGDDSSAVASMVVSEARREVEWQYSFDVHCNAYFTYFIWTRVVLYIALPVLLADGFISRFVTNGVFLVGCVTYVYNVFLGYLELPMLTQQQRLMYPIPFLVGLFVIVTLFTSKNLTLQGAISQWGTVW